MWLSLASYSLMTVLCARRAWQGAALQAAQGGSRGKPPGAVLRKLRRSCAVRLQVLKAQEARMRADPDSSEFSHLFWLQRSHCGFRCSIQCATIWSSSAPATTASTCATCGTSSPDSTTCECRCCRCPRCSCPALGQLPLLRRAVIYFGTNASVAQQFRESSEFYFESRAFLFQNYRNVSANPLLVLASPTFALAVIVG